MFDLIFSQTVITLVTLFVEREWNRVSLSCLSLWLSPLGQWWVLSRAMYLGTIPFTKDGRVLNLKWRIILALPQWLAASITVQKWNAWRHVHVTVHATPSISDQMIAPVSSFGHQRCVCLTTLQAVLYWWGSIGAREYLHGILSHRLSESCNGWNHMMLDRDGTFLQPLRSKGKSPVCCMRGLMCLGLLSSRVGNSLLCWWMANRWHALKHFRFWHTYGQTITRGSTLQLAMRFQLPPSLVDIGETEHRFMLLMYITMLLGNQAFTTQPLKWCMSEVSKYLPWVC